MTSAKDKIPRRKLIENLVQGSAALGLGGLVWGNTLKSSGQNLVLRPPGALPEKDFLKACLKCGQCVVACPYDSLKLASVKDNVVSGTPLFEARDIPCYMCTDFPCVRECPSKALSEESITVNGQVSINNAKMGLAVIHKESCIAFWGIQCDACYRACPLMGKAITLETEKNVHTQKHANLKPVINSDICTGCGLCEHVCVVEKAAVKILPREVATGKVGDHYIKSWDGTDEERIRNITDETKTNKDIKSALDYLNSEDNLTDRE